MPPVPSLMKAASSSFIAKKIQPSQNIRWRVSIIRVLLYGNKDHHYNNNYRGGGGGFIIAEENEEEDQDEDDKDPDNKHHINNIHM